jgi:hypothetical protein
VPAASSFSKSPARCAPDRTLQPPACFPLISRLL